MFLSANKVAYVIFHLKQHVSTKALDKDNYIVLNENDELLSNIKNKIIFLLSEASVPDSAFVSFMGRNIPVLFPFSGSQQELFRFDENGNLIFGFDFLSSVFYLLSGQQEMEVSQRDRYGRFPFAYSLQCRLGCVHLPLVNYYMEMLVQGLESFATENSLPFRRKRLFDNLGFVLSHDVDRISFHHPFRILFKVKQFLGLAPLHYSRSKTIKLIFEGIIFRINPFRKEDPWWNFDWIVALEKRLGIRSTFFFLKQEDRFDNSLYKFHFKKIKNLIKELKSGGFEVGLHGTMRSVADRENLVKQKNDLSKILGESPVGIRQHYLRFFQPETFTIQESAGLKYDTSLGFAEQDGYRNGYCYPFHPYDFEKDRMMKIWEIPLVMMEVSVLQYRREGFEPLKKSVSHYIEEAKKFGGLFSLLWHNCRLSEYEYNGVTVFYETLLEEIMEENPKVLTGKQLMEEREEFNA
ncbi:polysaccharide deacetylase family protein [Marinilabilia sp.]|uniref:polysaccharide deacetylase family protein n=1 Tax=Marinilabilia sp. TaxID=2021252 RepID=UPI0025B87660|nr:polysaccharide deacetylase family protein [Marinilabilia sp.]